MADNRKTFRLHDDLATVISQYAADHNGISENEAVNRIIQERADLLKRISELRAESDQRMERIIASDKERGQLRDAYDDLTKALQIVGAALRGPLDLEYHKGRYKGPGAR